jgi:hypothetical protein
MAVLQNFLLSQMYDCPKFGTWAYELMALSAHPIFAPSQLNKKAEDMRCPAYLSR